MAKARHGVNSPMYRSTPVKGDVPAPSIALLPWGDVIEDYLQGIGISLEAFCGEMTGGWLFGYVDALRQAGVRTVIACFSRQVPDAVCFINQPTQAPVWVLPASKYYLKVRQRMRNPYGWSLQDMFGNVRPGQRWIYHSIRAATPYLATPLRPLADVLRREHCGAILCQEYEDPRFDLCVALGRWLRLPVFATFQGGSWQRSGMERLIRPWTVGACSGLIIASQDEVERVQTRYGIPDTKIARIYNALDLGRWHKQGRKEARQRLGISSEALVVAWHGRVDIYRKGLDILLEAWQRVYDGFQRHERTLLLIGSGDDAEELRQRLKTVQGVLWIDHYVMDQDVVRQYLATADIYVFPSRHEGFPVAPIEAMACELPVVATRAPGVSEIFERGVSSGGEIVECGDVEALAESLRRLLEDDALRQTMAKQARNRAEAAFSPSVVGAQLRTFLLKNRMLSV